MASNQKNRDADEADIEIPVPSILDTATHAEFLTLYRESAATRRFIKAHQWKTVGATMFAYLGIIFIAGFVHADLALKQSLMWVTIILCCGVILTLVIYQFWMQNELMKIEGIQKYMSTGFGSIRAIKPKLEGNVHRYILLAFMIFIVIVGAVVVSLALSRIS